MDCYIKSLEDSDDADTWVNLGTAGGGKVKEKRYSPRECYEKALWLNNESSTVWYNLGNDGGGMVRGEDVSNCSCYLRSLNLDPKFPHAWLKVGKCGGGKVTGACDGRKCSRKHCYERAAEIHPRFGEAWEALGGVGGGEVHGVKYTSEDCKSKAQALLAREEAEGWYGFGVAGGVRQSNGVHYSKEESR